LVGIYWAINIVLALAQALIALFIIVAYVRSVRAVGSRISKTLLLLSVLVASQGLAASAAYYLLSGFTGPEVAVPLLPVTALGVAAAGILLYISTR